MAKPEWGAKHTCPSCDTRFYDMKRSPAVCPECSATVETQSQAKLKRKASTAEPAKKPKAAPVVAAKVAEVPDEPVVDDDVVDDDVVVEDEDDDSLIEDASDLGEDEDDISEAKEHIDDGISD